MGLGEAKIVKRAVKNECQAGNCFNNARLWQKRHRGSVVTGWALRGWPETLFEAEQHAIVRKSDGRLIDVSPHIYDGKTCFVECSLSAFSSDGLALNCNKYCNTARGSRRLLVDALIQCCVDKQVYELACKKVVDGELVFLGDLELLSDMLKQAKALAQELGMQI